MVLGMALLSMESIFSQVRYRLLESMAPRACTTCEVVASPLPTMAIPRATATPNGDRHTLASWDSWSECDTSFNPKSVRVQKGRPVVGVPGVEGDEVLGWARRGLALPADAIASAGRDVDGPAAD